MAPPEAVAGPTTIAPAEQPNERSNEQTNERSAADPVERPAVASASERRAAIAALMDAHGDEVFGLCYRALRDRALVEDVVQQVFLEAHRDLDRFAGRSSMRIWLFGIASHRCHDAIRRRNRTRQRIEDDEQAIYTFEDPGANPRDRVHRDQLLSALEACLQGLSPDVRMTVLLRFHGGMTYEEMAEPLAAKSDTLQTRVSRALPVLRRCLESKGWTHE